MGLLDVSPCYKTGGGSEIRYKGKLKKKKKWNIEPLLSSALKSCALLRAEARLVLCCEAQSHALLRGEAQSCTMLSGATPSCALLNGEAQSHRMLTGEAPSCAMLDG